MKKLILFSLLVFLLIITGCNQDATTTNSEENTKVVAFVSILPQADFVKQIGGEQVEVEVMIPAGANPATYEPTPEQLKRLARANVYFALGHVPFEKAWMERIKAANPDMQVIDTSAGIQLIDGNPHIWLSPQFIKVQAGFICRGLQKIDAGHRDYYEKNNNSFIAKINKLDQNICQTLQSKRGMYFLAYHPSWEYFARDYGLKQLAIEKNGQEPSAGEMADIIKEAAAKEVKVVVISPQFDTKNARAVANEIGAEILVLNPLFADYNYLLETAEKLAQSIG